MTSTELVVPAQLVDIRTGELVEATPAKAAELLVVVREMRDRMMGLVRDCEAVLLEESARQGTKTLHFGRATATVTAGQELQWDLSVLPRLLVLGLPDERYNELVKTTISYKVNARVANQLEGANEEYAKVIGEARSYVETPQRVYVK